MQLQCQQIQKYGFFCSTPALAFCSNLLGNHLAFSTHIMFWLDTKDFLCNVVIPIEESTLVLISLFNTEEHEAKVLIFNPVRAEVAENTGGPLESYGTHGYRLM